MKNSNSKVEPIDKTAIAQNRLLADVADSLEFIADSLSEEVLLRQMIDDWCIKQLGNTDEALEVSDKMFTAARDIFYNVS